MLYKESGKTGKKVSVISAGGMRHAEPHTLEKSTKTLLRAYEKGINSFDTAPIYCDDLNEKVLDCSHCMPRPLGIDIPRMMDTCNQKILPGSDEAVSFRLKWHRGINPEYTECGPCERTCTQHLPIIERLTYFSTLSECKK